MPPLSVICGAVCVQVRSDTMQETSDFSEVWWLQSGSMQDSTCRGWSVEDAVEHHV